jgi:hypothetical protein
MLELWEKVLLSKLKCMRVLTESDRVELIRLCCLDSVGLALLALLYFAVTSYLPTKLHLLAERVHWYIYGSEADIVSAY